MTDFGVEHAYPVNLKGTAFFYVEDLNPVDKNSKLQGLFSSVDERDIVAFTGISEEADWLKRNKVARDLENTGMNVVRGEKRIPYVIYRLPATIDREDLETIKTERDADIIFGGRRSGEQVAKTLDEMFDRYYTMYATGRLRLYNASLDRLDLRRYEPGSLYQLLSEFTWQLAGAIHLGDSSERERLESEMRTLTRGSNLADIMVNLIGAFKTSETNRGEIIECTIQQMCAALDGDKKVVEQLKDRIEELARRGEG